VLDSMFITCAYVLWAFDFARPIDENGKEAICGLEEVVDNAIAATPQPFDAVANPRRSDSTQPLYVMQVY